MKGDSAGVGKSGRQLVHMIVKIQLFGLPAITRWKLIIFG